MALEAALLPCLPARELQAIDRSPHLSHQREMSLRSGNLGDVSNLQFGSLNTNFASACSNIVCLAGTGVVASGHYMLGKNPGVVVPHGPSECLLNTIEACAIDTWPGLEDHFPFINCIETLVYQHQFTEWAQCFDKLNLDSKPIFECYDSGYGKKVSSSCQSQIT